MNSAQKLIEGLKSGDEISLARAMSLVENDHPFATEILQSIASKPKVPVVGITGPPGAGKSTLVTALIQQYVEKNLRIGVLAVDPTSPFNYGSLLGDRIRMHQYFTNPNVFIRSIATRGSLGGLSAKIVELCDVMQASTFDIIIIETVGVGQSEVEIAGIADTTIVTLVPEAGDEIQSIKSGVMEIADIFVVNKADRDAADLFCRNIEKLLAQKHQIDWKIPVLKTVASIHQGIEPLIAAIHKHNAIPKNTHLKVHLLAEKAFKLIQHKRMKGIALSELYQEIDKEIEKENFNLYRFIERY
jgi:LAO/AO transport system kinase